MKILFVVSILLSDKIFCVDNQFSVVPWDREVLLLEEKVDNLFSVVPWDREVLLLEEEIGNLIDQKNNILMCKKNLLGYFAIEYINEEINKKKELQKIGLHRYLNLTYNNNRRKWEDVLSNFFKGINEKEQKNRIQQSRNINVGKNENQLNKLLLEYLDTQNRNIDPWQKICINFEKNLKTRSLKNMAI